MNVKMNISKKQKNVFFSNVPKITQPKNQIPRSNIVLSSSRTDGHTDTHESEYRGHPFRVSGFFLSTYHRGSIQKLRIYDYLNKYILYITALLRPKHFFVVSGNMVSKSVVGKQAFFFRGQIV